jgi:hypothetical protein
MATAVVRFCRRSVPLWFLAFLFMCGDDLPLWFRPKTGAGIAGSDQGLRVAIDHNRRHDVPCRRHCGCGALSIGGPVRQRRCDQRGARVERPGRQNGAQHSQDERKYRKQCDGEVTHGARSVSIRHLSCLKSAPARKNFFTCVSILICCQMPEQCERNVLECLARRQWNSPRHQWSGVEM